MFKVLMFFCTGSHVCTEAGVLAGIGIPRSGQEKQGVCSQQQSFSQKCRFGSSNVLNYKFKFRHLDELKTSPCPNELQNVAQQSLEWHVVRCSLLSREGSTEGQKILSAGVQNCVRSQHLLFLA